MKAKNLSKIVGSSESITIEWKGSLSDTKGIIKSISAFSNTEGGKIIVGVSEKDGSPIGVRIGRGAIENFANIVSQHTDPKVHPRITVRKIEGKDIIIIEVKQSPHRPILADGIPYMRVGSSSLKMSKDDHES
ncbi:MAG: ATP-binding protein, partial [Candidatus Omnitrophota bacterium]|nr:ATP-binding protein [Candidatus Omnitrophota bacterium]